MCIDVSDTLYNIPQFSFFFLFIPKNGKEMAAVCSMLLLTGRLADRKYIT